MRTLTRLEMLSCMVEEYCAAPDTGKQIELCSRPGKAPNQNKSAGNIYYDRPDDRKQYPSTIDDMALDKCEMLEEKDQSNAEPAQKELDTLWKAAVQHLCNPCPFACRMN